MPIARRLILRCTLSLFLTVGAQVQAADTQPAKPAVYTETIKLQSLSDKLLYPATVSALRVVPVTAEVEGFVKELKAELGQKVAQGSTLLRIANPDPVYHYEPFAVTAPFAGVITGIDIAVGDRVQKGRTLLTLTDNKDLKIKINITGEDLALLTPKQQADLLIGEGIWPLRIRALSPIIDPATGTAACELELSDKAKASSLVPGKLGQVVFKIAERKGFVVPESAIYYRGRDVYVVRVDEKNKAQYLTVKILKNREGKFEIAGAALKEGQAIVTHATVYIADGEELDVKAAEANP